MRSIWSGAISFGLIYIPVRLYSGTESQELDFDLLRRDDKCRIRYARVCRDTGEEVQWEDIVKGYEYKKGNYVILEEEDFKRANIQKSKTIDIISFVNAEEIDQKYLEKPYYLEPDKNAKKVYALLREALKKSGKVGVARFVMRSREHLALLNAEDDLILLNQMRFASEIRSPSDLDLPKREGLQEQELEMAVKLIEQLTEPWEPEKHKDTYIEDIKRIIQEKIDGKEIEPVEEEAVPIEVTDLFSKLSQSLEMAKDRNKRE